jgi:hypothetical protein
VVNKIENRLGLVNGKRVLIHHDGYRGADLPVAFIFDECRRTMVNR